MPDTGTSAAYSIVSWVRRGMASLVTGQPTTNYASLPVSIGINGTAIPAPAVRLLGPGDVTGLDPRAIIRSDPRDGADAFEPNYLAMVELALPDLPWMFTPSGDVNGYLQPWLCLIVVPDAPGAEINTAAGGLNLLRITAPLDPKLELPDLKTIGWWAHAQVTGAEGTDVNAAFTNDTAGTLSRLVSPRKLEPSKAYMACVVPTYHAGVNAALGVAVDENDVAPAWDSTVTAPVTLPVYYSFRFQTGPGGDFGSLARAITPGSAAATGTRLMGVGDPQFGASPVMGTPAPVLGLEGALQAVDISGNVENSVAQWPNDSLKNAYNDKLSAALKGANANPPVVTPPAYGSAQSGFQLFPPTPPASLPKPPLAPEWLGELNLDPRTRAAAAAGAQVVQKNQDVLVASTWEQAGEIRKMNGLLKQGQFAREISASLLTRHIGTVESDGALLQMTAPMHARLTGPSAQLTLRGSIAASLLPSGATSGAMRKLTRIRGPIGRQIRPKINLNIVDRLNKLPVAGTDALRVAAPVTPPSGMVAFDDVDPTFPALQKTAMLSALVAPTSGWKVQEVKAPREVLALKEEVRPETVRVSEVSTAALKSRVPIIPVAVVGPVTVATLKETWSANLPAILSTTRKDLPAPLAFPSSEDDLSLMHDQFRAAATNVVNYLGDPPPADAVSQPLSFRSQLMTRINPEITIKARLGSRIPIGVGTDPLEPVRSGPEFPSSPMYEPLAELSPEWMLPGISSIAIDKAMLVEPNARFIESYMLGLNEELSSELLWRQYPADLSSTFFQNFWTSSLTGSAATDIPEIQRFDPNKHLGQHVNELASAKTVVLLIRANLFRRYPNAIVSLVQAKWVDGSKAGSKMRALAGPFNYPSFRGEIGLDVTFFGFALDELQLDPGPPAQGRPQTPADLQGSTDPKDNNAGWYFVIEEHLAEPRFGLEPDELLDQQQATGSTQPVWADLSWADLPAAKATGATFLDPLVPPAKHKTLENVTWGTNAASMAYILMREPMRVALHAVALLEFPATKAAKS